VRRRSVGPTGPQRGDPGARSPPGPIDKPPLVGLQALRKREAQLPRNRAEALRECDDGTEPGLSYQVKRCDPVSLGIKTSRGSPPDEIGERPRLAGRNRERAKRIPASAPTGCSQISTSLWRARSRGFYWRAHFNELQCHSRRRDHHRVVSVARTKPRRAAPGIWAIPSILAPAGHASYHLSHHLNSVLL